MTMQQKTLLESNLDLKERIREALRLGGLKTPAYYPEFLKNGDEIRALQRLVAESIRGYFSEHRRPTPLDAIYSRVMEKIWILRQDGHWPGTWNPRPTKRTIDRRANEVASRNPLENLTMIDGKPFAIAPKAGSYLPNPALFEDVARILKETQP